jgi:hypothetical protein
MGYHVVTLRFTNGERLTDRTVLNGRELLVDERERLPLELLEAILPQSSPDEPCR